MTRWLIAILTVQCLLSPLSVSGQQAQRNTVANSVDEEEKLIKDFLSNPKNPFLSVIPKIKPIVLPPPPVVKKVEVKKEPPPPPPLNMAKVSQEFKLSGFVWGSEKPQAIINEQVVNVGDTIKKAKVISISKKGVRIFYMGENIILTVDNKYNSKL